jgi:hypothetical protein
LFQKTRSITGLRPAYTTWNEINKGLLTEPEGPSMEEDLRWGAAASFSLNVETPWDVLRAQLLWAIWCQRVAHSFQEEQFHLGIVLWQAWRNTIYSVMEAYKELFRHKQNEEKRQEMITCFQTIWTAAGVFGRLGNDGIQWNLTPHSEFLPRDLGARWRNPSRSTASPPLWISKLTSQRDRTCRT